MALRSRRSERQCNHASEGLPIAAAIFTNAVADELIVRNPCQARGAGHEHSPERKPPTTAQVAQVADAIERRYLLLLVLLSAWATLRDGEAIGLRCRDFDLLHGAVTIDERMIQLDGGVLQVGKPEDGCGGADSRDRRRTCSPRSKRTLPSTSKATQTRGCSSAEGRDASPRELLRDLHRVQKKAGLSGKSPLSSTVARRSSRPVKPSALTGRIHSPGEPGGNSIPATRSGQRGRRIVACRLALGPSLVRDCRWVVGSGQVVTAGGRVDRDIFNGPVYSALGGGSFASCPPSRTNAVGRLSENHRSAGSSNGCWYQPSACTICHATPTYARPLLSRDARRGGAALSARRDARKVRQNLVERVTGIETGMASLPGWGLPQQRGLYGPARDT